VLIHIGFLLKFKVLQFENREKKWFPAILNEKEYEAKQVNAF
jgi:hypothetical protein